MAWSADDEYRTRSVARTRTVLKLRDPSPAYGPAAVVLLYATGLMGAVMAVHGFADPATIDTGALAIPAGVAAAGTAMIVGGRLRQYEERSFAGLVVRTMMIWAFFGLAWTFLQAAMGAAISPAGSLAGLREILVGASQQMIAGAFIGAVGGLCGGVAAAALCVEKVR